VLPTSPLLVGLSHVLGALNLPYTSTPSIEERLVSSASLLITDIDNFSATLIADTEVRILVFCNEYCPPDTQRVAYVSPSAPTSYIMEIASGWVMRPSAELSTREREILSLVSQGYSNEEIASHCYVSTATVKTHLLRSFRKLGVSDRASAVYKAVKMGLIV